MNTTLIYPPRTLADLISRPSDRIARIALDTSLVLGGATLTAVMAQVAVHLGFTPVPVTGQTLAVLLTGTALGWRRGALCQLLYWALGMIMPVAWFAGGEHGWQAATGATAGYLVGFVVAAAVVGYLAEKRQDRSLSTSLPAMLAGSALIYLCGVLWLAHRLDLPVTGGTSNAVDLGLTPFLAGDLIKLLIAGVATPVAWKLAHRPVR